MSYARFGWDGSDVYVFGSKTPDGVHEIECCGCRLTSDYRKPPPGHRLAEKYPDLEFDFGPPQHYRTKAGILAHLAEHAEAGHHVPPECIGEIRETGWIPEGDPENPEPVIHRASAEPS